MLPDSPPFPSIKVCGLTRAEDAQAAYQAGADALGVVAVSQSPRAVTAQLALQVFADLPAEVWKVAVSVNASPADVMDFCQTSGCNAVQLCGAEQAEEWNDFPLPILRRVGVDSSALSTMPTWAATAWGFVLDHPSAAGGTGKNVDPILARSLAAQHRCLLAGGIQPENVSHLIQQVQPAGVDASSGLEESPGMKNLPKMTAYIQNARTALEAIQI